jgi:hypothetical protein
MSVTNPHIRWAQGGEAVLGSISTDTVTLVSTVPSPPGSRIEGTLVSEPAARVKFKIHGSRKQDDGSFRLEGRPIDLTKELRERMQALVAAQSAD